MFRPAVAAEIDRDPAALKLGGERREMTVMFTDIQGFTDLSERLDEHKLTRAAQLLSGRDVVAGAGQRRHAR